MHEWVLSIPVRSCVVFLSCFPLICFITPFDLRSFVIEREWRRRTTPNHKPCAPCMSRRIRSSIINLPAWDDMLCSEIICGNSEKRTEMNIYLSRLLPWFAFMVRVIDYDLLKYRPLMWLLIILQIIYAENQNRKMGWLTIYESSLLINAWIRKWSAT